MPTITERLDERLRAGRARDVPQPAPGAWQRTLEEFRVPDVPRDAATARAWLVCESPHTEEVTDDPIGERFPLRGRAGKNVTQALIECGHLEERDGRPHGQGSYVPVGRLARDDALDSIRIVNVCELPLQSQAYAQRIDQELIDDIPGTLPFMEWAQILRAFESVRNLRVHDPVPADQPLARDVLEDFHDRVGNSEAIRVRRVVLCGRTAKACWRVLNLPGDQARFVAHPSRGGWYEGGRVKAEVREALQWLFRLRN